MNPIEIDTLVEQRLRVLNIICAALVVSVLIYVAIAWFLLQQGALSGSSELPGILPAVLTAAGLSMVFLAPVLSSIFLKQGVAAAGDDTAGKLNAFQSSVIMGFAVREAAAVIGLVLSFLTGKIVWVGALSAVAVVSMLLAWPKRETMLELTGSGPGPIA